MHLAANPAAPVYFRCHACRASLRLSDPSTFAVTLLWGLAAGSIVLALTAFADRMELLRLPILLRGLVAGIVVVAVMLAYVRCCAALVERDDETDGIYRRGVSLVALVGLLAFVVVAIVIMTIVG